MKHLAEILQDHGIASAEVIFGTAAAEKAPRERPLDVDRLTARLDAQARFNNRLIVTIVASYLAILAIIAALVIVHHDDLRWLAAGLGGNLLVLLTSVGFIRDLWREKVFIDALLAVLPSLTTAEAMKVLRTFYLEKVAPKGSAVAKKPSATTT